MLGLRRSEMKDMNEIPAEELKVAIAALNKILDTKIKTIGKKKSDVCEAFKNAVATFIEEDTVDQLPDEVVDFYNDYIADQEAEEEVEEKKEEKSSKKSAGKDSKKTPPGKGMKNTDGKDAGKETKKSEGVKRTRGTSGESNEDVAYNILANGGSEEDIDAKFRSIYKERGVTDKEFINKRIKIYTNIAKKKLAKDKPASTKQEKKTTPSKQEKKSVPSKQEKKPLKK